MSNAHARDARPHTLADLLATFAGHCATITTERPVRRDAPYCNRTIFGLGLSADPNDPHAPTISVMIRITPSSYAQTGEHGGAWGVWAQVSIATPRDARDLCDDASWERAEREGRVTWCGNRCGGVNAYANLMAPIIAACAAKEAGRK